LNPFLYPKSRHRRTQQPQGYSYYPSYKPFLRLEFGHQCVYCRLPDGMKGQDAFGVDHYRPKSLFPDLGTVYSNLFYACNCCNRRKGKFWPTIDQMRAGEFIPNPCDHVMFDHLRFQSARVVTRSPAGERADKTLMFNDDESVQYREFILGLIELAEQQRNRLRETLRTIEQQSELYPDRREALSQEKQSVDDELIKIEEYLRRIGGGSS
jgi:hypothetical protein